MPTWATVLITIAVILLILLAVLVIVGGRLQKKANSQQEAIQNAAQTVSMLIIDKKKLKISEANLPKIVTDQIPKYAKRAKFPIVKAKVIGMPGNKPMNLIADAKVFEILPVGKECKVSLSGIYITEIKSVRGGAVPVPPKKKSFLDRFRKSDKKAKADNSASDSKDSKKKK